MRAPKKTKRKTRHAFLPTIGKKQTNKKLISTLRLMQELINPLLPFFCPIFFCFFLSYYPLNIKRFHEEKKRKINRKEIESTPRISFFFLFIRYVIIHENFFVVFKKDNIFSRTKLQFMNNMVKNYLRISFL